MSTNGGKTDTLTRDGRDLYLSSITWLCRASRVVGKCHLLFLPSMREDGIRRNIPVELFEEEVLGVDEAYFD